MSKRQSPKPATSFSAKNPADAFERLRRIALHPRHHTQAFALNPGETGLWFAALSWSHDVECLRAVSGQDSKTTLTRITVNHTPRLANGDIIRHQPVLQLMHSKSADDESVSLVFADTAKLNSLRKSLNSYRGPKAVQAAITAQCRA